jgi:hypothetical protein
MPSLAHAFQAAVALLIGLVVYRLLTGGIRMRGLLSAQGSSNNDPERVQMLVTWLGGVGIYASEVFQNVGKGMNSLPEVPEVLLVGLTSSQLLYLVGKLVRHERG